jgi:hypothetical protein
VLIAIGVGDLRVHRDCMPLASMRSIIRTFAVAIVVLASTGCGGSTAAGDGPAGDYPYSADEVSAAFSAHNETLARLYEAGQGDDGPFILPAEGITPPDAVLASQGSDAKTYYQVLVFASEEGASDAVAKAPDEMARVGRVTTLQERNVVAFVPVDGEKREVVQSALDDLGG